MSADPINNLDEYEQVSSQMSDKQLSEMKIINRGHLGVPEEILKVDSYFGILVKKYKKMNQ